MHDIDLMAAFTGKQTAEEKKQEFLWPGFGTTSLGMLAGQDGVGKTYYAILASIAIACPDPRADLLGIAPTNHGKVIHFVCEDDLKTVRERIKAIGKLLPASCLESIFANLTIRLLEEVRYDLRMPNDVDRAIADTKGYRLAIIDTLNDFHMGKTNDPADMLDYMKGCARIVQTNKMSLINVHHVTKQSIRDEDDTTVAITGGAPLSSKSRYVKVMRSMTKTEGLQFSDSANGAPIVGHNALKNFVCVGVRKATRGCDIEDRWYRKNEDGVLLPIELTPAGQRIGKQNLHFIQPKNNGPKQHAKNFSAESKGNGIKKEAKQARKDWN